MERRGPPNAPRSTWIWATALTLATTASVIAPTPALADRRFAVDVRAGSGVSVGGGDGQATLHRTPVYVEAGATSWLDDEQNVLVGGSVRVEVEDRASIGGVLRAGLRADLGPLEIRPFAGLAAILMPYTLIGPEVGAFIVVELAGPLSLIVHLAIDAWLFGSDLPPSTVLFMGNGGLGVEIAL
ncbi:MAG: hypothetical protein J0L92_26350 [Deltaproteobacteria bacterium]|nr:hypothetical protein [Deltaproteobacteria bacterium]